MSGQVLRTPGLTAASWRASMENMSPYFASCTTPHDFSYPLFLQWNSDNSHGKITKAALRAEWKRNVDCMKESEFQVLRETASRLTKEWDTKTHTQDEQSFFDTQASKEKLERIRQQVHEAVDCVMAKRQRLVYYKEDKALDDSLREVVAGKTFVYVNCYQYFEGAAYRHVASLRLLITILCCTLIAPSLTGVDKGDEDETDVEDLKVMEALEVVANEELVDDEDDAGEAVDDEDDESIDDLVRELEELIEKSEPGFHPLIRALYHAVSLSLFLKCSDVKVFTGR